MNKRIKPIIIVVVVLIIVCTILWRVYYDEKNLYKENALVVKVYKTGMLCYNNGEVYKVSFDRRGDIGFKESQDIEIIYKQINSKFKSKEINILKERSDTEITDNILRKAYNKKSKVEGEITEITDGRFVFTIRDRNKQPYQYADNYKIYKVDGNMWYMKWFNKDKVKEVDVINPTVPAKAKNVVYKEEKVTILQKEFDWNDRYGTLREGFYCFIAEDEEDKECLILYFSIDRQRNYNLRSAMSDKEYDGLIINSKGCGYCAK